MTEAEWTNTAANLVAYIRSNVLAERAAWVFIRNVGRALRLAVVNPVGIFGLPLVEGLSYSVGLALQMMTSIPAVPRLATAVGDVRVVSDLRIRAASAPDTAGQRFLTIVW